MLATMQCTCGKHLDAHTHKPGDPAQCPACGNVFVIGELVKTTTAIQTEAPPAKPTLAAPQAFVGPEPQSIEKPNELSWRERLLMFGIALSVAFVMISTLGFFCVGPIGGGHRQTEVASTQMKGPLTSACNAFKLKNGRWPANLEELLQKNDNGGPYLESRDALLDPWGNRYQYDVKGPMNNGTRPDIWTEVPNDGRKLGNWPAIRKD
jgi:hypothetical protein